MPSKKLAALFLRDFKPARSQQTAAIGGAVMAAQGALVTKLLKLGQKDSPLHGLKPDQV